MNDAEWVALRSTWREKQLQLPADVQQFARRQARGLWLSHAILWPIVAGEGVFSIWILSRKEGWQTTGVARLDAWVILSFIFALSVWFVASQRGLWPGSLETPGEMLARFERDLRRGRIASWIGAGGFFGLTLFVLGQVAILRGGVGPAWHSSKEVFAWAGVGLATFVIVPRWFARRARLVQARIDRWRGE